MKWLLFHSLVTQMLMVYLIGGSNLFGLNPNDATDAYLDNDGDGLNNLNEYLSSSDPSLTDTDADGLSDGDEVNTYQTSPIKIDTDKDGLSDSDEVRLYLTQPNNSDSDNDGITDGWEITYRLSPLDNSDANQDSDNDSFSNLEEFYLHTDPNNSADFKKAQPWVTYQANAKHDGFVLQLIADANIKELWRRELSSAVVGSLTAANGKAFVSTGNTELYSINGFDAFSGVLLWSKEASDNSKSPPRIADSISSLAYSNGYVYYQTAHKKQLFVKKP